MLFFFKVDHIHNFFTSEQKVCALFHVQQGIYGHIVTKITSSKAHNNIYNLGKYCLIMPRKLSNLTNHFDYFIVNNCSIQNVYNSRMSQVSNSRMFCLHSWSIACGLTQCYDMRLYFLI